MDADALVLGAGFTGIAAARDLRDAGRTAIVLEARDRIGGRTWYREMPGTGVHVEYGGMFFSRATQPHLAREIERYGVAVSPPKEPAQIAWIRGADRREGEEALDDVRAKLAGSRFTAALAETGEAFESGDRRALAAFDVAAAAWIDALEADDEVADYLRAFSASMGGAPIERSSVLPLLWDMVELDYDPVDAFMETGELFTDGTKSLIDAMAEGLDVRFGSVVRRVEHDVRRVRVTLDDGTALVAPAAIVALPLNVWADVEFDPPLAAPKLRAAGERHAGQVSKVLATARHAPDTFLGMGWDTPINAGFVTKRTPDGAHLFMGFSAQDRVDLSDHAAVTEAVNAHLPEATVVATDGHDWVSDPYAKGTWLAIPPGWFSDGTFEALGEPEGRVAFAGSDIASEGAGWIEGAVGSGIAAAAWSSACSPRADPATPRAAAAQSGTRRPSTHRPHA
ncbi:MAG: flavin monoamine oxidase family protein [Actinomycetota bacterium]